MTEYIDENDVPKIPRRANWNEFFSAIPKGKARVLRNTSPSTARTALYRLQAKGKFLNLRCTIRKNKERKHDSFIVNPSVQTGDT